MYLDFESIVILAGVYWLLYRAFASLPAEYDRKNTANRRYQHNRL